MARRSRSKKARARAKAAALARRATKILALSCVGLVLLSVGVVGSLRWINPPTTAFMLRAKIAAIREGRRDFVVQQRWADRWNISDQAAIAVVAAEDQLFPTHGGFDLRSIGNAVREKFQGGRVRGASTITQQVAKNLFLWPGRDYVRKLLEAYATVLLELLLPKRRILEIYLNIAQFGDGIYGVPAASRHFFSTAPGDLRADQAAMLAAVLPSPRRYHVNRPSAYVLERRAWILDQMHSLGGPSYIANM